MVEMQFKKANEFQLIDFGSGINEAQRTDKVFISRKCMNQSSYVEKYEIKPLKVPSPLQSSKNYIKKNFSPSKSCAFEFILAHFPIIEMVRTYKAKYFLRDLIGGFTVGAMQIAPSSY